MGTDNDIEIKVYYKGIELPKDIPTLEFTVRPTGELAIWFKNGKTAYFKGVDTDEVYIATESETDQTLCFEYFGESSQKMKMAMFSLNDIAGYSYSID